MHSNAKTSSPNIIRVTDYFEQGGYAVVAMELTNINFEKMLEKLEPTEIPILFLQICNGVEAIYGKKIAHRDLKPENVLLLNDEVKIADFGLVVYLDQPRVRYGL